MHEAASQLHLHEWIKQDMCKSIKKRTKDMEINPKELGTYDTPHTSCEIYRTGWIPVELAPLHAFELKVLWTT